MSVTFKKGAYYPGIQQQYEFAKVIQATKTKQ